MQQLKFKPFLWPLIPAWAHFLKFKLSHDPNPLQYFTAGTIHVYSSHNGVDRTTVAMNTERINDYYH